MKKVFYIALALAMVMYFGGISFAGEHGGKEHGGKEHGSKEHGGKAQEVQKTAEHGGKVQEVQKTAEHGGKEKEPPSADDIRGTMKSYILGKAAASGSFDVKDPETGNVRRLALVKVHERVGKTGDYYYSCADFTDLDSGEVLDLDLDVEDNGGNLSVADVRIHKVSGKERYTYDENDNRIPLSE